MEVFDPWGVRMEAALDLFSDGQLLTFSGVDFRLVGADVLECSVESSWQLAGVTEAAARNDLASAHRTLEYLRQASPRFSALASGRKVRSVLFSGYGMGSVDICSETDGKITWAAGFGKEGPT
jgi:hypothetical protein